MIRLCEAADVDAGTARGFECSGLSFIVVNWESQYSAFENRCPHLGIELNFMPDDFLDRDQRYLVCANHGALFEPDSGECVYGPCQGQSLRSIECKVCDGFIFVAVEPRGENAPA